MSPPALQEALLQALGGRMTSNKDGQCTFNLCWAFAALSEQDFLAPRLQQDDAICCRQPASPEP